MSAVCGVAGFMIFDTDVLIWMTRGNVKAARLFDSDPNRAVSIVTCMELYHGVRDKRELASTRELLSEFDVIALTENIGYRACIYMEQLALKIGLDPMDAQIAATAIEHQRTLCTGNAKHYRHIPDIDLQVFRP